MAISAELGETLEKVVADLVENGRYNSKSEVLREGVRLVQEHGSVSRMLKFRRGWTTSPPDGRTRPMRFSIASEVA